LREPLDPLFQHTNHLLAVSRDGEDLYYGLSLLFPPGEVFDRATVLLIKEEKGLCSVDPAVKCLLDFYFDSNNERMSLFRELREINRRQWDLEDRVRTEQSAEAAVAARENNNLRVACKNKINKLFGYGNEVKCYKGES